MTIKKLIIPLTLSLCLPVISNADVMSLISSNSDTDYHYVAIKAGVAIPNTIKGTSDLQGTSGNSSAAAGLLVGHKIMDRFGVELEYLHRNKTSLNNSSLPNDINTTNSWGVSANTLMLNMSIDLLTNGDIRPYAKLGAGFSSNKSSPYIYTIDDNTETWAGKKTTDFAWQAGIGATIATSKMIDTIFEYNFINRGNFKTAATSTYSANGDSRDLSKSTAKTGKLIEQVITIGLRVKF